MGGALVDIVNTTPLRPQQVLRVFYQTCLAVHHMHTLTPPIIHRDLKVGVFMCACACVYRMLSLPLPPPPSPLPLPPPQVENLLLDRAGGVRLCDFGSATTERVLPDDTWTHTQRGLVEEEVGGQRRGEGEVLEGKGEGG